jgi:hypothetical protein
MPLLTGTWRLFVGGLEVPLGISNLQASGVFQVDAALPWPPNYFRSLRAGDHPPP